MDEREIPEIALIESFSKVVAITVGLLYIAGYLTVTLHFSRYGVSGFSLLHLQYLVAGAWVLVPPFFLALGIHVSGRFYQKAVPDVVSGFNWKRFMIASSLIGLPVSLVTLPALTVPTAGTWTGRRIVTAIGMVTSIWICIQVFWMAWRCEPEKETWWRSRKDAAPFYATLLCYLVVQYTIWFSGQVYPSIPFAAGGGRPLTVVLMEGEKKFPEGIKEAEGGKKSIPYKLLMTTDKSYILQAQPPGELSIEVSRDSVAGMVVMNDAIEITTDKPPLVQPETTKPPQAQPKAGDLPKTK